MAEVADRADLEELRDFLLASIDDLDRERAAGDLSDSDHRTLRDDYTARAAEVIRALDDRKPTRRNNGRTTPAIASRMVVIGAVAAVAVLIGVLVAQASGRRDTGEGISGAGGVRRTATQEAQACFDRFRVAPVESLECLDRVLARAPDNPTALTYRGWILYQTGDPELGDRGQETLQAAVDADPQFPDARFFRSIIAADEARFDDALAELQFIEDGPVAAQWRREVDRQRAAIQERRGG